MVERLGSSLSATCARKGVRRVAKLATSSTTQYLGHDWKFGFKIQTSRLELSRLSVLLARREKKHSVRKEVLAT
jgi:hypothetical protein